MGAEYFIVSALFLWLFKEENMGLLSYVQSLFSAPKPQATTSKPTSSYPNTITQGGYVKAKQVSVSPSGALQVTYVPVKPVASAPPTTQVKASTPTSTYRPPATTTSSGGGGTGSTGTSSYSSSYSGPEIPPEPSLPEPQGISDDELNRIYEGVYGVYNERQRQLENQLPTELGKITTYEQDLLSPILQREKEAPTEAATQKADAEFEKYRTERSRNMVSDFDRAVKELEKKEGEVG